MPGPGEDTVFSPAPVAGIIGENGEVFTSGDFNLAADAEGYVGVYFYHTPLSEVYEERDVADVDDIGTPRSHSLLSGNSEPLCHSGSESGSDDVPVHHPSPSAQSWYQGMTNQPSDKVFASARFVASQRVAYQGQAPGHQFGFDPCAECGFLTTNYCGGPPMDG